MYGQGLETQQLAFRNKGDHLWIPCSELTVAHPEPPRGGEAQAGVPVILLGDVKPRALCHQDCDSAARLPKLIYKAAKLLCRHFSKRGPSNSGEWGETGDTPEVGLSSCAGGASEPGRRCPGWSPAPRVPINVC